MPIPDRSGAVPSGVSCHKTRGMALETSSKYRASHATAPARTRRPPAFRPEVPASSRPRRRRHRTDRAPPARRPRPAPGYGGTEWDRDRKFRPEVR